MDLQGGSSDWVYAHFQGSPVDSDDLNAPISHHDNHGSFQWDMSKAIGGSSTNPFLASDSSTASSSPSSPSSSGSSNSLIRAHGTLASLTFILIFPLGALLIRLANTLPHLAWIHGTFQLLGSLLFVAASGLGIHLAQTASYLNEPHAIIGLFLFSIIFFMPILGAIHHTLYKKLHRRTVWSYAHIFTGRVAILLGMINGGFGLQLANAEREHKIAYGVFAGVVGVVYVGVVGVGEVQRRAAGRTGEEGDGARRKDVVGKEREKGRG